jgi:hypothetical protein
MSHNYKKDSSAHMITNTPPQQTHTKIPVNSYSCHQWGEKKKEKKNEKTKCSGMNDSKHCPNSVSS